MMPDAKQDTSTSYLLPLEDAAAAKLFGKLSRDDQDEPLATLLSKYTFWSPHVGEELPFRHVIVARATSDIGLVLNTSHPFVFGGLGTATSDVTLQLDYTGQWQELDDVDPHNLNRRLNGLSRHSSANEGPQEETYVVATGSTRFAPSRLLIRTNEDLLFALPIFPTKLNRRQFGRFVE